MITTAYRCENCEREFYISSVNQPLRPAAHGAVVCCPFCGNLRAGGLISSAGIEIAIRQIHKKCIQLVQLIRDGNRVVAQIKASERVREMAARLAAPRVSR